MRISLDLETRCIVKECPYYHKSMCVNGHSLSPWHAEITTIATTDEIGCSVVYTLDQFLICASAGDFVNCVFDGHNFKFDWLFLAVHGWQIPLEEWVGDSSIAAYVLPEKIDDQWLDEYDKQRKLKGNHHRKASKHSLKTLAPFFLGVEPFWEVEDHSNAEYAIKDTIYTRQLNILLEKKLREHKAFEFYQRLLEWTKMLALAELRGILYDQPEAAAMTSKLEIEQVALYNTLQKQWDDAAETKLYIDLEKLSQQRKLLKKSNPSLDERARLKLKKGLNYSSPSQIMWLLRDYLKLNVTEDDGIDSTGAAVLRRLSEEREDVKVFHKWRKNNKLLTSFFPAYKGFCVDGAVHPIYNVDVTRTGRTSSQRPNAQQVTSKLKPLFKGRPGYKIVGFDAAGIEAKIIAYYTEDPTLCGILKDGTSIHDFNCRNWFNLDCDLKDIKERFPKERKATKNVGFALFYNAGFNRIKIALAQAGFLISEDRAKQIHKQFKTDFRVAHKKAQDFVYRFQFGEVVYNLFGRPLIIETPQDAYMKGFNKLIQSSASDYLLYSSHRAFEQMQAEKLEAHPLLFVHDYVGFEVLEKDCQRAADIIKLSMTNYELSTQNGPIQLEVDGGISDVWK